MERERKENLQVGKNPCDQYLDDEIDLYELWLIIKKRRKVVYISTFLVTLIGLIYILLATPFYKTEAKLGVAINLPQTITDKFFVAGIRINYGDILEDFHLKKQVLKPYWDLLQGYYGEKLKEEPKKVVNEVLGIYSKNGFWNLYVEFPQNGTIAYKIAQSYILLIKENIKKAYRKLIEELFETNQKQIEELTHKLQLLEKAYEDFLSGKIKTIPWIVSPVSELKPPQGKSLKELNLWKFKVQTEILKQQLEELYKQKQFLEDYKTILTLNAIKVVEPPLEPKKPFKPKKLLVLTVSFVGGLFLGLFAVFFLEYLEERKKQIQEKGS